MWCWLAGLVASLVLFVVAVVGWCWQCEQGSLAPFASPCCCCLRLNCRCTQVLPLHCIAAIGIQGTPTARACTYLYVCCMCERVCFSTCVLQLVPGCRGIAVYRRGCFSAVCHGNSCCCRACVLPASTHCYYASLQHYCYYYHLPCQQLVFGLVGWLGAFLCLLFSVLCSCCLLLA